MGPAHLTSSGGGVWPAARMPCIRGPARRSSWPGVNAGQTYHTPHAIPQQMALVELWGLLMKLQIPKFLPK